MTHPAPNGVALALKDRRMFRRLIDMAVFAGDHLADAHDWVRETRPEAAPTEAARPDAAPNDAARPIGPITPPPTEPAAIPRTSPDGAAAMPQAATAAPERPGATLAMLAIAAGAGFACGIAVMVLF